MRLMNLLPRSRGSIITGGICLVLGISLGCVVGPIRRAYLAEEVATAELPQRTRAQSFDEIYFDRKGSKEQWRPKKVEPDYDRIGRHLAWTFSSPRAWAAFQKSPFAGDEEKRLADAALRELRGKEAVPVSVLGIEAPWWEDVPDPMNARSATWGTGRF
jgi:hypothetical protein